MVAEHDKAEFDVVVVGSGAGGLTTAVVAALHGLRTLVVEKASVLGGTTAYSGGGLWIPNNPHFSDLGSNDSTEDAVTYMRHLLGNHYDPDKVGAYLESGPEMVRFLEEKTPVQFFVVPLPDYSPNAPGAKVGRTILAKEYNGRELGSWVEKVRNVLPGFAAFGTMQTDLQHLEKFKSAFRTVEGFTFSAKRFANFVYDLLRYGKGANMANGNALVGRLLKAALDNSVTIWTDAPAVRLEATDGAVTGIVIKRNRTEVAVTAKRGVVLATGGFGGNKAMTAAVMPMPEHHVSLHPETNEGDGINLGKGAGGAMPSPNPDNGVWAPISVFRNKAGDVVAKYPHFGPDRGKPGTVIVDPSGKRFANEAEPYQQFVNAMNERKIGTAYLIGDHRFLRKYGMGLALPAPLPYKKWIRNGYLTLGNTIPELAAKLGIDPDALDATVTEFNRHARDGVDPQFNRGGNSYDNAQGDWMHKPNANLEPLENAPFYAVPIHPGNVSTIYGLETSVDAQVLRPDGTEIPGLYAVGLDQNSVMRGFYPGGGSSIGPAMAFGYRAARKMANQG